MGSLTACPIQISGDGTPEREKPWRGSCEDVAIEASPGRDNIDPLVQHPVEGAVVVVEGVVVVVVVDVVVVANVVATIILSVVVNVWIIYVITKDNNINNNNNNNDK